jgi:hypothetical protein
MTKLFLRQYTEQVIWSAALLWLFFIDPDTQQYSLCIFKLLGFSSCPGCGIGHSIHYALHLEFAEAYRHHILGIPAIFLLLWQIIKPFFKFKKYNNHGPAIINDAKGHTT